MKCCGKCANLRQLGELTCRARQKIFTKKKKTKVGKIKNLIETLSTIVNGVFWVIFRSMPFSMPTAGPPVCALKHTEARLRARTHSSSCIQCVSSWAALQWLLLFVVVYGKNRYLHTCWVTFITARWKQRWKRWKCSCTSPFRLALDFNFLCLVPHLLVFK